MSQGVALLFVCAATFAAWLANTRWSGIVLPSATRGRFALRGFGIAIVAWLFFLATVVLATIIGGSIRNDFAVAAVLVLLSLGAAIAGPRWTSPMRPERTHRRKVARSLTWLAGVIVTVLAGIDLASNG